MIALLATLLAVLAFVLGWRLRGRRSRIGRTGVAPSVGSDPTARIDPSGPSGGLDARPDDPAGLPAAGDVTGHAAGHVGSVATATPGARRSSGRTPPAADTAAPAVIPPPSPADGVRWIGRYRLEGELGRGSMGVVHLARPPDAGAPPVALKTMALAREFGATELADVRARFFREAEVAARLRHPGIVRVLDAGEDGGIAFIAMEWVPGRTLAHHALPGTLLAVPVVLEVLARVADALAHAHRQGVVHRDLKPANVMLDTATDTVKITDFGIAHVADACHTRTGLVLGTPSFMSPEQMTGARVDGRSDLYAVGVMLHQLLTGHLPHASDSMAELLRAIVNEPAPDVRRACPSLPASVAAIVARALAKPPDERHPDADELARDLRAAASTFHAAP